MLGGREEYVQCLTGKLLSTGPHQIIAGYDALNPQSRCIRLKGGNRGGSLAPVLQSNNSNTVLGT